MGDVAGKCPLLDAIGAEPIIPTPGAMVKNVVVVIGR